MKIKTSELTGAALDWAVCSATGLLAAYPKIASGANFLRVHQGNSSKYIYPSTNWAQGGAIIEREKIHWGIGVQIGDKQPSYIASIYRVYDKPLRGPTPLIAAMRCFVASKLGDGVDVPDELAEASIDPPNTSVHN